MPMKALLLAQLLLWVSISACCASLNFSVDVHHGRCDCGQAHYQLGRIQFVTPAQGWATAFYIGETPGHVSQSSTVVHTEDGGRNWRPVAGIETYGVNVEPAFWFIDAQHGWIGWPTTPDAKAHLLRTSDGGRSWRKAGLTLPDTPIHLRFFDRKMGYLFSSTPDGGRFYATTDGSARWSSRNETQLIATYPDVTQFVSPGIGWLAGSRNTGGTFAPSILWTVDGGHMWHQASIPETVRGDAIDLFFVDADQGWLILWNTGKEPSTLLHSLDGGHTWAVQGNPRFGGGPKYLNSVRFLSRQIGIVFVRYASSESSEFQPTNRAAALVTADGGESWQEYPLPGVVQSCQVVMGEIWCSSGMDILKIRLHGTGSRAER